MHFVQKCKIKQACCNISYLFTYNLIQLMLSELNLERKYFDETA